MDHLRIKPQDDLHLQQMELEQGMTELGIDRFRTRTEKAMGKGQEENTAYGSTLIASCTEKVALGITDFLEGADSGKPGRRHASLKYLRMIEPRVAAYLALQAVLQSISVEQRTQTVARRIGQMIEDETRYREVRAEDRGLYKFLKEEVKKRDDYRNKRTTVNYILNKREFAWDTWPQRDLVIIGLKLIEIIMDTIGLVEMRMNSAGVKDKTHFLAPTAETLSWINDRNAAAELLSPIYEPMIVKPLPWSSPFDGGYMTRGVRPVRLIKTPNKNYLEELSNIEMPVVYAAVNAAQETAWSINPFILDVLNHLWDHGQAHGGLPARFDTPIPAKPFDIAENEEARKEWRAEAARTHKENRETLSKRTQLSYALATSNKYRDFPELYFPHQMDFRGRLYGVPQLNPQGPDFMKGLLHFSTGKPLDEESANFLAIHIANCGAFSKIDKSPLEDRVAWVYENEERILLAATDPFADLWWTEADSPFQFLAGCFEWAGWLKFGEGFLSQLPVALDGSCSGIQHFSMALKDEVGGAAVNLVASDKPADIYSLVMERAYEAMRADMAQDKDEHRREMATQWITFAPGRSCFKRPTMTYGYGSREYGFRDQIMTDTLKPARKAYLEGEGVWPFEHDGFQASLYMAKVISQAVDEVVVKAAEAMNWLKGTAKLIASEGLPVHWTTPDGMPILQAYQNRKPFRIDTLIGGTRVVLSILNEQPGVDKKAQAQGISPNFVHSLDATHLRLSVVRALEEGMTSFALVHDSFGVHAADTPRFFQLLRETLVEMYTTCDVIGNFKDEIMAQLEPKNRKKMLEEPEAGSLDLNSVLDSAYCFA